MADGMSNRSARGRFAAAVTYREISTGDAAVRLPTSGFYFNHSNCWANIEGSRARVGVSDLVGQKAADLLSFEPPRVGLEYTIFDELCTLITSRTTIEIMSPVSGTVAAFNTELVESPWLIKEDPYERGWAVELELTDIGNDIELLLDCEQYAELAEARIRNGPRRFCPCTPLGSIVRPREQ